MVRRRDLLQTGAALAVGVLAGKAAAATPPRPDFVMPTPEGHLQISALSGRAMRVRVVPHGKALTTQPSLILEDTGAAPRLSVSRAGDAFRLRLAHLSCTVEAQTGRLTFFDTSGRTLLTEAPGSRRLTPSMLGDEAVFIAEQGFVSPEDERLFGTGCFQDGHLNLRQLPRRLTQVNSQISLPFVLSSRGYGLLWHNMGLSDFNPTRQVVALTKAAADGPAQSADVTTATGNARVERRQAVFEAQIEAAAGGRHAFMLDVGRKMASRYFVEIDGVVMVDFSNIWLPPTTSFFVELMPGAHTVRVIANEEDTPRLFFGTTQAQTHWRSPVSEAIDYVVIAGPDADDVMAGYREISGATPMMPKWAYGYIHCRERFTSSAEILENAKEFRRRKLPVDIMVQDWQYWGKYGWNAMRFDEDHYPDPAALTGELHEMGMRLMLSVWSKIGRGTDMGKLAAAGNHYIPDTEWIDFFSPKTAAFYWENFNRRLGGLGIDSWWLDATEPENDDLDGRMTAAGRGEHLRLTYPLHVTRTVYNGQRSARPDQRVMILSRCAFPGQHRYAAATWSGDIGNGWDTLKRQIPAGLNMAAAGYPYWTVDAGGFFRPGDDQYTDEAYHERFIRWFQMATFLPLQRVHGYMTKTEFWRYGPRVEDISRRFLELRYRLLPYTYSMAASVTREGGPIIRPLVFDFPEDAAALDQSHAFMFGRSIHVAPVLEAGRETWPVYLPQSPGGWYDFWSGERREGGRTHEVAAPIDSLPVHVRAGSILPLGPVLQSTREATGTQFELKVYPGRDGHVSLYDDDGVSYGYERGRSALTRIDWDDRRQKLTIGARTGRFDGMAREQTFTVNVPGLAPRVVTYDGKAISVSLGA